MDYRVTVRLQKCLYFNFYIYILWVIVIGFFLYIKIDTIGHVSKYLSVTVYTLLTPINGIRLYLGNSGNLSSRVPELAGFLMLSVLMQMPLVSFFLFNPYLNNTPTEIILHAVFWINTVLEIIFSFLALKHASSIAKRIYLNRCKSM